MIEGSILVPLGVFDQNGVEKTGVTFGYVLNTTSYDVSRLDAAAGRLVEKWRLLPGRLEYDNKTKNWCIRVPTGKLDGIKTHQFTSSISTEPLDVPFTRVNTTSVEILPQPALKYFRDGSTPSSLTMFSKQQLPIMSIHISIFANCTCVGISVPHGVFDAIGMGQVVAGLDAELDNKPWTCPSFSPENILSQKLEELQRSSAKEDLDALECTKRVYHPMNFMNTVRFLLGLGREYLWHWVTVKGIYLGQKVVDLIVREVKEQLREESGGKKFVSTGDILVAWFLKAAHSDEIANDDPVFMTSAISLRSILSPSNPAFSTYTHNAIMMCTMPHLTTSSIHTSSIAKLATTHRSFIDTVRTPAFVQSYTHWMSSPEIGGSVLPIRLGARSWVFTNQVVAGLSRIDFGVEQAMFWVWTVPITLDHVCLMNMFNGGYILKTSMRKIQWVVFERELERLREEASRI